MASAFSEGYPAFEGEGVPIIKAITVEHPHSQFLINSLVDLVLEASNYAK